MFTPHRRGLGSEVKTGSGGQACPPKSFDYSRRFSWLRRWCGFQLSQRFIHALLEITPVAVLYPAPVRHDLHLTDRTLRYQGDMVGPLQDRSTDGHMSSVFHVVVSSHFAVATRQDVVVILRIAKRVFDRGCRPEPSRGTCSWEEQADRSLILQPQLRRACPERSRREWQNVARHVSAA